MNLRSLVAALSLLWCPLARAADPPSADTRIAVRYGYGDVLLIGGECIANTKGLSQMAYEASLMPARRTFIETPEYLRGTARSTPKPKTDWNIGDQWQVYTGAGPAVAVVIDKLVLFEYARKFHDGAIAHIVDPAAANLVAGLQAITYLAAPGEGLTAVSQVPLLSEHISGSSADEDHRRITPALVRKAREVVHDENWMTEQVDGDFIKKKVVEMNAGLLANTTDANFPDEVRILRWPLPGPQALLFVQVLWSRDDDPPLFAVNAVMERGSLKILSFDTEPAESMRTNNALTPNCTVGSFKCRSNNYPTSLDETNRFLNAWKIGDRYFVLTFSRELVGFAVTLQELRFESGLVPTSLGYRVNED